MTVNTAPADWEVPAEGWPEVPTCHGKVMRFTGDPHAYRVRDNLTALDHPYRTCAYCGSIHPQDLLTVLKAGGRMHGSDWKYGFPHKMYVDVPNARGGEITEVGSTSHSDRETGEYIREPIMGTAPATVMGKFYTEHLKDEGYSPETRSVLLRVLTAHTGIDWSWDEERGVIYQPPYFGYQKP